jgi:RNA polymerase-interacting CarD/CdnL/TRCF family regulator
MSNLAQKILQAKRKKNLRKRKEKLESDESDSDEEIKPIVNKDKKEHMEFSLEVADKLWSNLKNKIKKNSEFINFKDNDKLKEYQNSEFKDFCAEFPIVTRYAIVMGQYSAKAFRRFLIKCKSVTHDPTQSREKGYSEDQWVQRQADYVRYLWEAYQKQHYSTSESKNIWQHAYKTLTKEFTDFRDLHKDIEEKLKTDNKLNKSELVKELLSRMSTQEQNLDDTSTKNLLDKLKDQLLEQRKRKLLSELNAHDPKKTED